jgi:alpha-galactosidase
MSNMWGWEDCYVRIEGAVLRIGNSLMERSWSFHQGKPVSLSIRDKENNREWLTAEPQAAAFEFPWLPASAKPDAVLVTSFVDDDYGVAKKQLRADVEMQFGGFDRIVRFTVRVYPFGTFIRTGYALLPKGYTSDQDGISILVAPSDSDSNGGTASSPAAFQLDDNNKQRAVIDNDYCERLELQDVHCSWETVSFRDQTDTNNNLVGKDSGLLFRNEKRSLRGNILLLQGSLHRGGLVLIKEGATPQGHLQDRGMDFQFQGLALSVIGSGIGADDLLQQEEITAYGTTVGVYDGDVYSGYKLIDEYHRSLRVHKPDRDSFIMSNTWGDRSKDGRVSEEFLLAELQAAAGLGIDIVQIDDGWQKGVTSNSVNAQAVGGRWSDYYSGGGDFWSVHPERFPRGLTPIARLAREQNVKLGLWYSPDSANDYANWEKDIETLVKLHREYDICAFKLDGIHIGSKVGEARLLRILRQVIQATGGQVDFNLDTTSQKRFGYLGNTQYGNIFLENRYTDWRNYYPHWSLRNIWMLAPYVSATKLQMEFLNVNRNKEQYSDDPLAPSACGQIYSFAVTAFANPLAWMELTALDVDQTAALAAVIRALKPHHKQILAGHVLPIGEEPKGTSWTGLQSITGSNSGYILVFRELNPSSEYPMKLWGIKASERSSGAPALKVTELLRMDEKDTLATDRSEAPFLLALNDQDEVVFSRPAPFTFAIYRYEI